MPKINRIHMHAVDSHKILGLFLSASIMNELINLFDQPIGSEITKLLSMVRSQMGLSDANIELYSKIYDVHGSAIANHNRHSLFLSILKNGTPFLHLSLFLAPDHLNPRSQGSIHFFKNVYDPTRSLNSNKKRKLYTVIKVSQPSQHSLHFNIGKNHNTSKFPNHTKHEPEIQKEMEVILITLNHLFDENDEYYIGKSKNIVEIHPRTNNILRIINNKTPNYTRSNKGSYHMGFEKGYPYYKTPSKTTQSFTTIPTTIKRRRTLKKKASKDDKGA